MWISLVRSPQKAQEHSKLERGRCEVKRPSSSSWGPRGWDWGVAAFCWSYRPVLLGRMDMSTFPSHRWTRPSEELPWKQKQDVTSPGVIQRVRWGIGEKGLMFRARLVDSLSWGEDEEAECKAPAAQMLIGFLVRLPEWQMGSITWWLWSMLTPRGSV